MPKLKNEKSSVSHDYWIHEEMTNAIEVGLHYGFSIIDYVAPEKADAFQTDETSCLNPEEKIALLRKYFTSPNVQTPVMVMYERKGHGIKKNPKKIEYGFDIMGVHRSISDATLIKTLFETARDEGYEDLVVEVNSHGDKDSLARFGRELSSYFRKHIQELDPECRQLLKKSAFALVECSHEKCKTIKEQAPHPMNYLSEPSRVYFMELLELLEITNIPYTINNFLIDNPDFAVHTIFRLMGRDKHAKDPEVIATGTRWAGLGKKLGFKKDVPSISAIISLKRPKASAKKIKKPKFYFIQMGQEAKLHSLNLIEHLRKSKIPIYHALSKDKLAAQLSAAEYLKVPFVLIMGQKESVERTVLIRETNYRTQDTVRIEHVADYLKKLIK